MVCRHHLRQPHPPGSGGDPLSQPRTALITGITGQDGSYLAEQLLADGWRVVGLVRRLSADNHSRLRHLIHTAPPHALTLACADLLDQGAMERVLDDHRPEEVYNLAAQSFVPESWNQPTLTAEVTGLGLLRLLEAVRRLGKPYPRIYQASSSEMFGHAGDGLQDEHTPFLPRSPYAVAKLFAHHTAISYRQAYQIPIVCGILFNHESPRRGMEFVTRKIAHGAAAIAAGSRSRLRLGALTPRRDWGYAPDYTRAMQAILRREPLEELVIATGESHSVEDFAQLAFEAVGLDYRDHVEVDPALVRRNELPGLRGNPHRAQVALGWRPSVSFPELVRRMVEAERTGAV